MTWDDPAVARLYEAFDLAHDRYRRANEELVREAGVEPGMRVLDVGAGLGGTARAALPADVVCVEPAAAMRARGLRDPHVVWRADLPEGEVFDRVLCGASIWLLGPLPEVIPRLAELTGGALAFTIPALYVGDGPGFLPDPAPILRAAGLESRDWSFEVRLTRAALRDRLELTQALVAGGRTTEEIDRVYEQTGPCHERWRGWVAS